MSQELRENKLTSKRELQKLVDEDRKISELQYKIPFIYECMGNTIYGNKHTDFKELEEIVKEKESDLDKMDRALSGLRVEAQKKDLFQDYHELTLMIQTIRKENEQFDIELNDVTKQISKD